MSFDTEDLEDIAPESMEEAGEHVPSEEEVQKLLDENSGLEDDDRVKKASIVGFYIATAMQGEENEKLEQAYEEVMREEGYDPDSIEDALDYMMELSLDLRSDYEIP